MIFSTGLKKDMLLGAIPLLGRGLANECSVTRVLLCAVRDELSNGVLSPLAADLRTLPNSRRKAMAWRYRAPGRISDSRSHPSYSASQLTAQDVVAF